MFKRITSVSQLSPSVARPAAQRSTPLHTPIVYPPAANRGFGASPNVPDTDKQKEYNHQQDFDRNSLNPERAEGTRSGTDNEVASSESAYDPSKTSPESELAATEEESQQKGKPASPLSVSGANKEVNEYRDPREGLPDHNVNRGVHSERGASPKNRPVSPYSKR